MAERDDDTTDEYPAPSQETGSSKRVRVEAAGLSDRGRVRESNEDHFLVARVGRFLDALMTNMPDDELPDRFDETGHALVVADGMGGAAGGEVASRLAIKTLIRVARSLPDWIVNLNDEHARELMRRGADYYREINKTISEQALQEPTLAGMGTTMTAAYNARQDLFVAHVGDSRAYMYRDGRLQQLTRDHTHAQALAEAGLIAREEVATHRLRHVLTNALGGHPGEVAVEVHRIQIVDGDQLLLCTDGLTDQVDDESIATVLGRPMSAAQVCRLLIDLALERGGQDNITAVLGRYRVPD